jgi:serine/threonine protein phosphatase PrpC
MEQRIKVDQDFIDFKDSKEIRERIPKYFRDSFQVVHEDLYKKQYDINLSGSTVTTVLFDGYRVYCANAGDSRAVLYTQSKKGGIKVTPLSEDHKPSLPKEKARIEKCNGRVEPILGPQGQFLGPDRVWMQNEDTPGLAMSRSLGDGLAHTLGVSWEPGK